VGERSGIVAFSHPARSPQEVVQQLFAGEGIIVSASPAGVRVAPHFYNTQSEIDRFLSALP
jgi:selenocysteine lyase/cysteine desulfurase